jgi:fructose-1,6-bisphosphatase
MDNQTRLEQDLAYVLKNISRASYDVNELLYHGYKITDKRRVYMNIMIRLDSIDRAVQELLRQRSEL